MITDNLFEEILLEPATKSANTLHIVSGYASATMAYKHLERLKEYGKGVRIELIVGMAVRDGISVKDHEGFQELTSGQYRCLFSCRYVVYSPAVHSKSFAWYRDNEPAIAFTGSANYTQSAFGSHRREAMIRHDAEDARNYFDLIQQNTIECSDPRVGSLIALHKEPAFSLKRAEGADEVDEEDDARKTADELKRLPHRKVSLLDNQGTLPGRSGLNWGQRPEESREPNQAYIRLPIRLANTISY